MTMVKAEQDNLKALVAAMTNGHFPAGAPQTPTKAGSSSQPTRPPGGAQGGVRKKTAPPQQKAKVARNSIPAQVIDNRVSAATKKVTIHGKVTRVLQRGDSKFRAATVQTEKRRAGWITKAYASERPTDVSYTRGDVQRRYDDLNRAVATVYRERQKDTSPDKRALEKMKYTARHHELTMKLLETIDSVPYTALCKRERKQVLLPAEVRDIQDWYAYLAEEAHNWGGRQRGPRWEEAERQNQDLRLVTFSEYRRRAHAEALLMLMN